MAAGLLALLALLVVLLGLAGLVLATPVRVALTAHTAPQRRVKVALRLFGGWAPPFALYDTQRRRPAKPEEKPEKKTKKRSRSKPARLGRMIPEAPRLAAGLLRPIHLDGLTVDADIGLDDPADTGQLFGLLTAIKASWPPRPGVSVAVRPDFSGPRLSGDIDARFSVTPAAWIAPCTRFAWRVFGPRS